MVVWDKNPPVGNRVKVGTVAVRFGHVFDSFKLRTRLLLIRKREVIDSDERT